jgi:putative N6-adenine-specific DNA methylase
MYASFAVTAPGLEHLAAAELAAVGATVGAVEVGGVAFEAAPGILYAANLRLRAASRVVVRAASFHAASFADLEREARKVSWPRWVADGAAVHFRVTSRTSRLYHQDAVAERMERAVVRALPRVRAVRAPSDADALDGDVASLPGVLRFLVRIVDDELTLSVDSSGALLHRRGYRQDSAKAPLRETLAAALLLAMGWDGSVPLVDPLCGSGTIPIEAALLARRIPPGWRRRFAFERWPEFKPPVWEYVRGEAGKAIAEEAVAPIIAADRDAGAVEACAANAERAGVAGDLSIRRAALTATLSGPEVGGLPPGLVLTNPPYGVRVGDRDSLRNLYASLGNAMRGPLADWSLGFVTSDPALAAAVGLPRETRLTVSSGGLRVALHAVLPAPR